MPLFLAKRVGALLVTLLVSSMLVFASTYLVPGDPAVYLAGGDKATPERIATIRAEFNLDQPPLTRYFDWLGGALHGDFGTSLQYREDVGDLIATRLPVSATLILYAAILILFCGFSLGLIAALRRGVVDRLIVGLTSVAVATPTFVSALVLISVFAVGLGWFPTTGAGEGFLNRSWHMILPAVALALLYSATIARVARSSFIEALSGEHVLVARSRGVQERQVVWKHVVRNALGPVATLSGLVVAGLLVSTTIVETAFGIGGIGSLLRQSVERQDFPVLQAISMLVIATFLIVNTIIDALYPLIDPRISLSGKGAQR